MVFISIFLYPKPSSTWFIRMSFSIVNGVGACFCKDIIIIAIYIEIKSSSDCKSNRVLYKNSVRSVLHINNNILRFQM
jgi:uncharacterized membrane protein YkgB